MLHGAVRKRHSQEAIPGAHTLTSTTEFREFVQKAERELWTLFKSIDRDGNNKLDKQELNEAFSKAGIHVSNTKLDQFFAKVDQNHDGVITFDEWRYYHPHLSHHPRTTLTIHDRNFLLFIPAESPGLKAVFSYFATSVKVNPEGDVHLSDETIQGLGTYIRHRLLFLLHLFKPIAPPRIRHRPPDVVGGGTHYSASQSTVAQSHDRASRDFEPWHDGALEEDLSLYLPEADQKAPQSMRSRLMDILPKPGYFLAGGIAGIISRTSTAPLDRLKVYLIAQTGSSNEAIAAAKSGAGIQATKAATNSLVQACKELWRAGGIRSLWAGQLTRVFWIAYIGD